MSRILVFDQDNRAVDEFVATADRGYLLYGNPSVSGELQTKLTIGLADFTSHMQFGRCVLVEHPSLPPWMGVIDPPWKATLPVQATVYGAAYLLALRVPDAQRTLTGSISSIIGQMIGEANMQSDLYVRLGEVSNVDGTTRQETLTQKSVWEQIRAFCERTATEVILRPELVNGQLYLYLDLSSNAGVDTGYLLHDGAQSNFEITNANVDGSLRNRIIGTGTQSTAQSRIQAGPFTDEEMSGVMRLRSDVVQFRDATVLSDLEKKTQTHLEISAHPRLVVSGNVLLSDAQAARNLRLGNWYAMHLSEVYLAGGVHGWRGSMRVVKFFVEEDRNAANVTMEAFL